MVEQVLRRQHDDAQAKNQTGQQLFQQLLDHLEQIEAS
jgi:hypothetical protein